MSILTQFQAFLAANTAAAQAYRDVIAVVEALRVSVRDNQGHLKTFMPSYALIGGAVRDIDQNGAAANPRNFNLAIDTSPHQLREVIQKFSNRQSSPYGQQVTQGGKDFVFNTLRQSPDFRRSGRTSKSTFQDLADAAFTNLEAVAIEIREGDPALSEPPLVYTVYDQGYSQAISSGTLEIKNEVGQVPTQLIRVAELKKRYNLTLGPGLEEWAQSHEQTAKNDDLLTKAQAAYYGGNASATGAEIRATLDTAVTAAKGRKPTPPGRGKRP